MKVNLWFGGGLTRSEIKTTWQRGEKRKWGGRSGKKVLFWKKVDTRKKGGTSKGTSFVENKLMQGAGTYRGRGEGKDAKEKDHFQ